MSHMEQAYGFTPTHTEHKIISYSAYQISENVKNKNQNNYVENRKNRCRATAYLSHWNIGIK